MNRIKFSGLESHLSPQHVDTPEQEKLYVLLRTKFASY